MDEDTTAMPADDTMPAAPVEMPEEETQPTEEAPAA